MSGRILAWMMVAAGCALGGYAGFRLGAGGEGERPELAAARENAKVDDDKAARDSPSTHPADTPQELTRAMREAFRRGDRAALVRAQAKIPDFGKDGLLAALDELAAIRTGTERRELMWPILRRLVQIDPPLALERARTETDGMYLAGTCGMLLREWAELSPEAALAEARRMGRDDLNARFSYFHAVYGAWASQDFERALGLASGIDEPTEQDAALRALAGAAVGRENPGTELFRIAEAFSSPEGEREFIKRAVEAWGQRTDREEVEQWIDAQEIDAGYRAELLRFLAQAQSHRNPRQTADWLLARSTPESRAADLRTAVASWAYSQPEACGEWLESELTGPEADRAVSVYIGAIANRDPGEALRWAGRIHDDSLRRREYHDIVRAMGPIPEESVRETLHNAGLATELVEDLLERREPW